MSKTLERRVESMETRCNEIDDVGSYIEIDGIQVHLPRRLKLAELVKKMDEMPEECGQEK